MLQFWTRQLTNSNQSYRAFMTRLLDDSTAKNTDGLINAYLLDGNGGGRRLNWSELADCNPGENEWIWMHLDYSQPRVQQWMQEKSDLSPLTIEALLQAETRPRCVAADNGLMIFLRGVNLNPGSDPEDMVSIRLWIGERRIYSLRLRRLMSMDAVRESIDQGIAPNTPGDFLVLLIDLLLDRTSTIIEELYDQVDDLEDKVLVASDSQQRKQLADIRRQAIALRRFMAPQREALNRISAERSSILTDGHRLQLRENFDRLTRLVEDLDAARERAGVTHESLVSRIAEQTNERMYILSLVAAVFLPLSFVTGLLGINVGGIPGAENALGFSIVIILLLVVTGGIWAFFRWRRWF